MKKENKLGKRENTNKGITLIALVITIIVLLILATISIATLTGENGILTKAKVAEEETKKTTAEEEIILAVNEYLIQNEGDKSDLEALGKFLAEKLENLRIIEKNEDNIVVEYKGYKFKIDQNLNVTILEKLKMILTSKLEPSTATKDKVTITINIELLEPGIIVESVTPKTEGVNEIEINTKFSVTNNGIYQFEVKTSDEKEPKIYEIEVNNIDKEEPIAEIINMEEEVLIGNVGTITYQLKDNVELDLDECKILCTTSKTKLDANATTWRDNGKGLQKETGDFEYLFETKGTFYVHILAVDKVGNRATYVSSTPITVKMGSLYLFNEGKVNGYDWISDQAGSWTNIDSSIWCSEDIASWVVARWDLPFIDLSDFSQVHMEVSTGSKVDNTRCFSGRRTVECLSFMVVIRLNL